MKVLILSHGDVDGVCSTSIALISYLNKGLTSDDIDIVFTHPYTLINVLKKINTKYDEVVILDLSVNNAVVNVLMNKIIDGEFDRVILIDHHELSTKFTGLFDGIIDTSLTASQLTGIYFGVSSVLINVGTIGDKGILANPRDELLEEAELLREALCAHPKDDEFRYAVSYALLFRLPSEIPEVIRRAEISKQEKEEILNYAKKCIIYDKEFILVDIRDYGTKAHGKASYVAGRFCSETNKPTFVIFKSDSNEDVICSRTSKDHKINLNDLVQKIGVGGGHPNAASARLKPNTSVENIISTISKELQKVR